MQIRLAVIMLLGIFISSCDTTNRDQSDFHYASAEVKDFEEEQRIAATINPDFDLSLWAPGPLLSNAVALSFDNQGVAYVAETRRRKTSDLDIRAHRDWMESDLSLQSIEDTRAFHLKILATENSEANTWQEDYNGDSLRDYRDLEVQSEYIRRIWDSNGDGRADSSMLAGDGFDEMLTGVGAGILYHNEELFYTAAPHVYRLSDSDGDQQLDKRSIISSGFGIHIAYAGHDMSGLTIGPDGKVYWAIGDLGANVVDQDGQRWAYPNQGVVACANPDGSDFKIFAHGLRNTQELAFDDYGNLISVDNDGDHPGEHERFVHIVEGMDAGWRINWQYGKYNLPNEEYKVWTDERLHVPHFAGQAAYIVPPIALAPDGPAGLAYNPGTALGEKWQGYFFGSYFKGSSARSQIQAFKLSPKGSSFELADSIIIVKGIASTGATFGPDGALYINDWKDGYAKKPEGRIWKLDVQEKDSRREETQKILQNGFTNLTDNDLKKYLSYPDQRIRLGAQFQLVQRKQIELLSEVAANPDLELARLHAIWGIGQLGKQGTRIDEILIPLLGDANHHVKAQSAKVLGENQCEAALDALVELLGDDDGFVQYYGVEAIGKLGNSKPFNQLIALLATVEDKDPVLRHGIAFALAQLPVEKQLEQLADHPSKFVRIGAIVALRHKKAIEVKAFLNDQDSLVLAEAARAIHDDLSIPGALSALAKTLNNTEVENEAFVRRAINANLRIGGPESAQRLIAYATNLNRPKAMRQDALWALGYWSAPPNLDRVDGRYREIQPNNIQEVYQALEPHAPGLLRDKELDIRQSMALLAGRVKYQPVLAQLNQLLRSDRSPVVLRQEVLKSILAIDPKSDALEYTLSLDNQALVGTVLEIMETIEMDDQKQVSILQQVLEKGGIRQQQQALKNLTLIDSKELVQSIVEKWMDKLLKKQLKPELILEVLEAAQVVNSEAIAAQLALYSNGLDSVGKLDLYRETLFGGNERLGGRLFYRNNSAQCIRCHQINGLGGAVGPALTNIADQLSQEQLLESLIAPSARIAPGYGTVLLDLNDGESIAGILLREDDSNLMIRVGEEEQVISVSDIAKKEYLPSGMPTMEGVLNKREIRNVVAFLATLKGEKQVN